MSTHTITHRQAEALTNPFILSQTRQRRKSRIAVAFYSVTLVFDWESLLDSERLRVYRLLKFLMTIDDRNNIFLLTVFVFIKLSRYRVWWRQQWPFWITQPRISLSTFSHFKVCRAAPSPIDISKVTSLHWHSCTETEASRSKRTGTQHRSAIKHNFITCSSS